MATINYNGMELEEVTTPQIFDPPKKCVVWSDNVSPEERNVLAVLPRGSYRVMAEFDSTGVIQYQHCAILPDKPKPRRATWLDVARWCATGNGLVYDTDRDKIDTGIMFKPSNEHEPIVDEIKVRKWSDTEWHEPTVEYLFGGDK